MVSAMIKTMDEFVDLFGGADATAKAFGVGVTAVSNWKAWGRLPSRLHLRAVRLAAQRGMTIAEEILRDEPVTSPKPQAAE